MASTARHYTRKVEVFPHFEGGELGRRDITHPRTPGQFTASNMMVNYRGHLIPRPGLKNVTPSGTVNGIVSGFALTPVPTHDALFVQGTAIRTFDKFAANNLQTSVTALAGSPTYPIDWVVLGTTVYFCCQGAGGGIYSVDPTASPPVVSRLTGSPGARVLTVYNDRLVAGSINTPDNEIWWNGLTSGVSDFNSWPGANRILIGDNWRLTALDWQRNHLVIAKQNQWHVLTGQFGADGDFSNLVVRKASSAPGPLTPQAMTLDNEDKAWFQAIFDVFPSEFNGTYPKRYRDINFASQPGGYNADTSPPPIGVVPLGGTDQGAMFFEQNRAALYRNGTWTKHTFGVTLAGGLSASDSGPNVGGNIVYICDGGGASATPKFYVFDMGSDTPGLESGGSAYMRAGDDSATPIAGSVTFPEWWSPDVAEVQVRAVIVDFTAYNTGGNQNDHFDLTLNVMRRYESGDLLSSTQSFDSAPSNFTTAGTRQRKIFGFNDAGLGNGFSMQLTNVKGVELERIEVILEDHPVRMGT